MPHPAAARPTPSRSTTQPSVPSATSELLRRPAGRVAVAVAAAAALTAAGWGATVPFAGVAHAAGTVAPLPVGKRPNSTTLGFTLGDHVQATVDVGTGNLQVSSTDLTLPGIGADLPLGLDFNSLLLGAGSPLPSGGGGPGWAMRLGADTRLIVNADSSVLYLAPDGLEGLFTPGSVAGSYVSPAGFKADLTQTTSPAGWRLTDHASGRVSTFSSAGRLTGIADRNTNATTFGYTSGVLSTITSTRSGGTSTSPNIATVTVNADGTVASLAQSDGGSTTRTAGYGYTGGALTSITDAASRITRFGYDSATGDLTSVTSPGGAVTQFAFTATHQVAKVTQVNPSAGSPGNSITRLACRASSNSLPGGWFCHVIP